MATFDLSTMFGDSGTTPYDWNVDQPSTPTSGFYQNNPGNGAYGVTLDPGNGQNSSGFYIPGAWSNLSKPFTLNQYTANPSYDAEGAGPQLQSLQSGPSYSFNKYRMADPYGQVYELQDQAGKNYYANLGLGGRNASAPYNGLFGNPFPSGINNNDFYTQLQNNGSGSSLGVFRPENYGGKMPWSSSGGQGIDLFNSNPYENGYQLTGSAPDKGMSAMQQAMLLASSIAGFGSLWANGVGQLAGAGTAGAGGSLASMGGGTGLTQGAGGATGLTTGASGAGLATTPANIGAFESGISLPSLGVGGGLSGLSSIYKDALTNIAKQGGQSLATGKDIDPKQLLSAGVAPVLGQGLGGYSLSPEVKAGILNAAQTGNLSGGLATGLGQYAGNFAGGLTDSDFLNSILKGSIGSGAAGAIKAGLTGGDAGNAALLGGLFGGGTAGASNLLQRLAASLRTDTTGGASAAGVGGFNPAMAGKEFNMWDNEDNNQDWSNSPYGSGLNPSASNSGISPDAQTGFQMNSGSMPSGMPGMDASFKNYDIGGTEGGGQQGGGFLSNLFQGMSNPKVLGQLGSAAYGMYNANQLQKQLMNQAQQYAGQNDPFAAQRALTQQRLNQSYTNPQALAQSPEYRALGDLFQKQIAARDAAAGRNSQYGARAVEAQDNFMKYLNQYRGGLTNELSNYRPTGAGLAQQAALQQQAAQAGMAGKNQIPMLLGALFQGASPAIGSALSSYSGL